MKSNRLKHATSVYGICLLAVVGGGLIFGNVLAKRYAPLISTSLQQEDTKIVDIDDGEEQDTQYYKSKFKRQSRLYKKQVEFAKDVQGEGAVLLQNKGLPMAKSGNITLLGSSIAKDYFLVCGGGSGSIDTAKTPTLKEVFENNGYVVNPIAWDYYVNGSGKSTRGTNTVGEQSVSLLTETETNSFSSYNDAAIVVISRLGAEDADVAETTTEDSNKTMLELSQNELDLIDMATKSFDNVIVLLNTLNAIEVGPLMERNVSVVSISAGGQQGLQAIPEILNGTRNPSGRTVDTYVYDNYSSPAMVNFGDFTYANADSGFGSSKYLIYQEGIYVGYKYYETRYEDKVLNTANTGDYDYSTTVAYPFGYGLSYTDFEYSNYSVKESQESVEVSIDVKNVGSYSGKDVVEIYLQKPFDSSMNYEVASVDLVGFEKTSELKPGEIETVSVTVSKETFRSYDTTCDSNTGGYVIPSGDYYLSFGTNAHDALNNILSAKGKTASDGMDEEGDSTLVKTIDLDESESKLLTNYVNEADDGTTVKNKLSDIDASTYDSSVKYLSRKDWVNTWPKKFDFSATDALKTAMSEYYPNIENATMPKTGQSNGHSLIEMKGLKYDDEKWEELLDQLTVSDMQKFVTNGAYGTISITSINKDKVYDKDGPAGISATLIGGKGTFGYPVETLIAQTWNKELANKMGYFVGEDALLADVSGWYAPGLNIHRTPFSGRNFEYFSEDGFLSGEMGAEVTLGAQEMGVYTYSKHFALNDSELNRQSVCVFSNEQATRELYLAPFEANVKKGQTKGIMVAMNRVGGNWIGAHRGMVTDILRNEWGFEGSVVTDSSSIGNTQKGLYGGVNLWLSNSNGDFMSGYENDAGVVTMLRDSCHRVLYVTVNSNAMNGIAATSKIVNVMAPWKIWLIVVDVLVFGACLGGIGLITYYGFIKKDRKEDVTNA